MTWPSGLAPRAWTPTATPAASTTSGSAAPSAWRTPACASTGRPSGDPTLYPSDHVGVAAHLVDRVTARDRRARGRPLRLAHRGDWRVAPENTLAALEAAMRIPGCDGVEFDVRLSRDGVPVLLHDATLARVQGAPGARRPCRRRGAGRASASRAWTRSWPRSRDAWLDIELKGDDHGDATASVLRAARGEAPGSAVVSSFEPPTLVAMGERLPGWGRWLNTEDLAPATLSLARRPGLPRRVRDLGRDHARRDAPRARRRPGGGGVDGAPARDVRPAGPAGRRRRAAWRRRPSTGSARVQDEAAVGPGTRARAGRRRAARGRRGSGRRRQWRAVAE